MYRVQVVVERHSVLSVCKFASEEMCERKNAILRAFDKEGPQLSAYNTQMNMYQEKSRSTRSQYEKKYIDGINRSGCITLMTNVK